MLTEARVAAYRRDGFTVCEGFLSQAEVDDLLGEADAVCAGSTNRCHDAARLEMEPDQPPEGTAVRRLYEPCSYYPVARALSELDRLVDVVEQLCGPNLVFHYSKLNVKPAEVGSVVEWHQDLAYYPLTNRDSLAVLFYLDETDRGNGALQLLPGRHDSVLLEHTRDGYFQGRVTEAVDEAEAVLAEGRAGTAVFMHGLTPHASAPNRSQRPRRTMILSYRAADAFPIYCGPMTHKAEAHVRLVRGEAAREARFDQDRFPVPRYQGEIASLYDLQERSRVAEQGS
ncbi:MAG: phytanoyl-CoA dioxygenase family protein [Gemmatimonadaceae bacterium]|nr:phytanoyl-CoA dioxygenase family protein [Gemmatimonadaceae bacterium]